MEGLLPKKNKSAVLLRIGIEFSEIFEFMALHLGKKAMG